MSQIFVFVAYMSYKTLELLKIPTSINITDEIVHWLMKIGECRPFFEEHLGTPLELDLLRKAQVRAITYSNQIEGNSLGEKDVNDVLESNSKISSEEREVQNYKDALLFVEKLAEENREISQRDFCNIQKLVTNGFLEDDQSGQYRKIQVSIADANDNKIIDTLPEPHHISLAMDELWQWLEDTKNKNSFIRAFGFHLIAVAIHPFADGNGRSVRLMQHLLLLKSKERIAKFVPSETAIMRTRDVYYYSIREAKKLGRLDNMISYLAKCFYESASEATQEGRSILNTNKKLNPKQRREQILIFAKTVKEFSMSNLLELHPNVNRRTLERDLDLLVKEGMLKSKGEKKGRKYFV